MIFSIFWPFRLVTGILKLFLNVLVMLSCILTIMAFMGDRGWVWSLTTHFRVQYLVVQLLAFLLVSVAYWRHKKQDIKNGGHLERWLSLVFIGVFAGLNLVCVAPYYWPGQKPDALSPPVSTLKLMHFNLFGKTNHNTQAVLSAIQAEDPDLLDMVEYTETWRKTLEKSPVIKRYPYRISGQGLMALYSKRPLQHPRLVYAGVQKVENQANIIAQITLDKQPLTILVAHPASPMRPSHLTWLQESFAQWIQTRTKLGRHLIVVGDLNTSPWSVEFMTLTRKTGLRDSQLGYGLQPSWPMLLPFFGIRTEPNLLTQLLVVPIDHVLISEQIEVFSRHTGPFVGSDHLPVVVELGLRPSAL
ncbi:endonuclease/exonuclease/phosphatase family protein [Vampirovibrio sp.]|uniref:endonuclease/exonuclease/phosphatase family protein n=1 Tax=Vampirovibrio sp. TaxID=2717857 RepID=UPI003593DF25